MEDLGTEKVLMDERMGHIDGLISGRYAGVGRGVRLDRAGPDQRHLEVEVGGSQGVEVAVVVASWLTTTASMRPRVWTVAATGSPW
jgi:hypothetical protein